VQCLADMAECPVYLGVEGAQKIAEQSQLTPSSEYYGTSHWWASKVGFELEPFETNSDEDAALRLNTEDNGSIILYGILAMRRRYIQFYKNNAEGFLYQSQRNLVTIFGTSKFYQNGGTHFAKWDLSQSIMASSCPLANMWPFMAVPFYFNGLASTMVVDNNVGIPINTGSSYSGQDVLKCFAPLCTIYTYAILPTLTRLPQCDEYYTSGLIWGCD
jgi:hypothetical protein